MAESSVLRRQKGGNLLLKDALSKPNERDAIPRKHRPSLPPDRPSIAMHVSLLISHTRAFRSML